MMTIGEWLIAAGLAISVVYLVIGAFLETKRLDHLRYLYNLDPDSYKLELQGTQEGCWHEVGSHGWKGISSWAKARLFDKRTGRYIY